MHRCPSCYSDAQRRSLGEDNRDGRRPAVSEASRSGIFRYPPPDKLIRLSLPRYLIRRINTQYDRFTLNKLKFTAKLSSAEGTHLANECRLDASSPIARGKRGA